MAEEFNHHHHHHHHQNQPSWPFYNVINSPLDQSFLMINPPPSFTDLQPSEDDDMDIIINTSIHHFSDQLSPDCSSDGLAMITLSTEELLMNISDTNNSDASPMETAISTDSLDIPSEETELGNQVSVFHLLKAYGEAMEAGQGELADVIMASVSEKVSPAGDPLERLGFNLSKDLYNKEADYIEQEAAKNFESAFRAFYQIFPYGRFAHFAANSAIIESIPADVQTVHIFDFDIGEGVQWPPVIEALAGMGNKSVTLTAVTWETETETESDLEDGDWWPSMWNFEEVKGRLMDFSDRVGLKMEIHGVRIGDLKKKTKKFKLKQWCVFNCMILLPHMRRVRGREVISEFLSTAGESISESAGIVTRGEGGEPWEEESDVKLGEFFERNMVYYRSLLESIELSFPELAEARMALECLFAAPYISSREWIRRWTEMTTEAVVAVGEKWNVSKESLEEAKEMVKERQTAFGVRIGGHGRENEMVLEWNGTPLVRVRSIWRQ